MCECVGASVCTFPMGLGPVLFACRVPHPLATFPGVFFKRKIFSGKAEKSQQRRRLWQLKIIFAARAFLAATHVRASHTRHKRSAASTLAKQRPGSVRSKPQLCIAGRPGAECKVEREVGGSGLRRRRHCGCGNCGSGLSNTHTVSIALDVVVDGSVE